MLRLAQHDCQFFTPSEVKGSRVGYYSTIALSVYLCHKRRESSEPGGTRRMTLAAFILTLSTATFFFDFKLTFQKIRFGYSRAADDLVVSS